MKFEKRHFVLIGILILIVGTIIYLENGKVQSSNTSGGESAKVSETRADFKEIAGVKYPLAPELVGISGYLNTDGNEIKISDFQGKVVLIDFWTYTCINCIRTFPYLTSWDKKYRDKGLVIIGVHSPEFEFEKEKENVQKAVDKYGIKYAVVQDNEHATWSAFNNRYWPAKYLIDSEGYVRYFHFGEGNYEETEAKIQELLSEIGQNAELDLTKEIETNRRDTTPELYAGVLFAFPRNQFIGNKKNPERLEDFVLPIRLALKNTIYLDGKWYYNSDNLHLQGEEGVIAFDFTAEEVNIVADNLADAVEMDVLIDGEYVSPENAGDDVVFDGSRAFVIVDSARLYNVYRGEYGNYRLDLKVTKDFIFNAFTFG